MYIKSFSSFGRAPDERSYRFLCQGRSLPHSLHARCSALLRTAGYAGMLQAPHAFPKAIHTRAGIAPLQCPSYQTKNNPYPYDHS
ncbi:MAG: hypothetical protein ACK4KT_08145 [Thermaurantimonas sp.]